MRLLKSIYEISRAVCTNELERLRIEEELLINYVRNTNEDIRTKSRALERIKEINKLQLAILGG